MDFSSLLQQLRAGDASLETVRSWVEDCLEEKTVPPAAMLEALDSAVQNGLAEGAAAELRELIQGTTEPPPKIDPFANLDFDTGELSLTPDEPPVHKTDESSSNGDDADLLATLGELNRQHAAGKAPAAPPAAKPEQPVDSEAKTLLGEVPGAGEKTEVTAPPPETLDEDATILGDDQPTDRGSTTATTHSRETVPPTTGGDNTGTGSWRRGRAKDIKPGTILKDRFELVAAIGEGGMGTVFKARDLLKVEARDRNPYIAVKLLSGDFKEHPESFIALQRESSKAQKLAHPNIATVFDFDRDGSTVFMTMELLEGQELARYIKKLPPGGLPAAEALALIKQLCEGLAYAHGRGLVHSDMKPGNAYLTNEGALKLLDFGIARASKTRADASGETTLFDPGQLGALTPAYATLEMFEGEQPDQRDDIYALACISHELITGRHPFNKLSAVKVKEKGLTPTPIAKLTKRQNRALFKALSLERESRTGSVEEFWGDLQPRKNYTALYAGGGVAALLLTGLIGYAVVMPWLDRRQNDALIAELAQAPSEQIAPLLQQIGTLEPTARQYVLDGARDSIISDYAQRAESLVDPAANRYDFPAALQLIDELKTYYSDSAQVSSLEQTLTARRNSLIAEQTVLFDEYLQQDLLLPVENAADITDVVAILRQADPQNPLLGDARLIARYADLVRTEIKQQDYAQAAEILKIALVYAPQDASLANLNDQTQRELTRIANAERVAALKQQIEQARADIKQAADYATLKAPLLELAELRPDDGLVTEVQGELRSAVNKALTAHIAASQWGPAEDLLLAVAPLLAIDDLLDWRELLTRAEVKNNYQPASLSSRNATLEQRRTTLQSLLQNARFDADWHASIAATFREIITLLRPGSIWFEDLRNQITKTYIDHANQLIVANRFEAAQQVLDYASAYALTPQDMTAAHTRLVAAEEKYQAMEAERLRLARVDALKNQLRVQAEAGEVRNAETTLETLREELPADDVYVNQTGPQTIANAYLTLAAAQAEQQNYSSAATLAERAQKLAPKLPEANTRMNEYRRLAARENLYATASKATPANLPGLPEQLAAVQKLFPGDASTLESETIQQLAKRIKGLEDYDAVLANQLWDIARKVFPQREALTSLNLKPPPKPSKYVPAGREALQAGNLSKADSVLATAQREEPGNQQVAAFARELDAAKSEANRHFLAYQQSLRTGNRNQAKIYLEEAMRRWKDSDLYNSEFQGHFATTRAPTRAADGSRPCLASLAGYGSQGRAECFDMLGGTRAPTLVVVPAGGDNAQAYAISKFEISVEEYNLFCQRTGCSTLPGNGALPVINLPLKQVQAYIVWLGQQTGQAYRLPSAAEWTHAATAGNASAVRDFNCRVTQGGQILKGLSLLEARTGRENPWGLVNFVGNAQEWVRSGGGVTAVGGDFEDSLSECAITLSRPSDGSANSLTGFRVAKPVSE